MSSQLTSVSIHFRMGIAKLRFPKSDSDGVYIWPLDRLWRGRGFERPEAHTQQKFNPSNPTPSSPINIQFATL